MTLQYLPCFCNSGCDLLPCMSLTTRWRCSKADGVEAKAERRTGEIMERSERNRGTEKINDNNTQCGDIKLTQAWQVFLLKKAFFMYFFLQPFPFSQSISPSLYPADVRCKPIIDTDIHTSRHKAEQGGGGETHSVFKSDAY